MFSAINLLTRLVETKLSLGETMREDSHANLCDAWHIDNET